SALVESLTTAGHVVVPLRRPADWDPEKRTINLRLLDGVGAVVHLAGENIAGRRWTAAQKTRIQESRVKGTRWIAETVAALSQPPGVLVSASAIGYYGDRGSETLREESGPGSGFLAEVCKQWESATDIATRKGIRVVHLRTGLVLSKKGGALPKMLLPFKLGVGGKIGSGRQYWSWISLEDMCGAIQHCIAADGLHGAVNIVSPAPVTNLEFTKTLGRVLRRPTVFPLPEFAARLVLGEMADALLLASARVEPAKLHASRFVFRHKELESALRAVL
ncbi:MAG TPA: TIGR01777 family oxidoreductase, partial [Terriglobia bacterium]|nr:TIGR01777 family oxidoreductase [Terriglobia bacterium]